MFLNFAVEVGAITEDEAEVTLPRAWTALRALAGQQRELQQQQDPVRRGLALLGAAIPSGRHHITLPNGRPPDDAPMPWGWRLADAVPAPWLSSSPAGTRRLRKTSLARSVSISGRRRVTVEHALARVGQIQGPRARYWGLRRNLFDRRRTTVIANLFALRDAGYEAAA